MLRKLFHNLLDMEHGPLGAAITSGLTFCLTAFAILQVAGIDGSLVLFLALLLVSVLITFSVHWYFLDNKFRSLQARSLAPDEEKRKQLLGEIAQQLPPSIREKTSILIASYDRTIRSLQDQLRRVAHFQEPKLIEGAEYSPIHSLGEKTARTITSFLIDRMPVTNLQFEEFLADPANEQWLPGVVEKRFEIPYYLCEFQTVTVPPDKWNHPVVWVSWYAAAAFCNWRSLSTCPSLQPVYGFEDSAGRTTVTINEDANGWRLPREIEWEFALTRGGEVTCFQADPTRHNFAFFYRGTTPVTRFPECPAGMYDMLGNVKEWCNDASFLEPELHPDETNFHLDQPRVFRGASWMDPIERICADSRGRLPPVNTNPDLGFRCARSV